MKLSCEKRYDEIREAVADFIEDFGVRRYPFDIFVLIMRMGIKLVPYSSLDSTTRAAMLYFYPDATTRVDGCLGVQSLTIFYNDVGISVERIRFTLAHELGHIYLETDDEDEANLFANYLLAPAPMVLKYSRNDAETIGRHFNVSYSCARAVQDRAINRVRCRKPIYEYEKRIINYCYMNIGSDAMKDTNS